MIRSRSMTMLLLILCFAGLLTFPQPAYADTYNVTNLNDSGSGSLRQAVLSANLNPGNDTITFSVSGTITLTSGVILITDSGSLTIEGSGVTVSGNNSTRVFSIGGATTAILNNLTVTGGSETIDGGGIYNQGNLTLNNVTVTGNTANFGGGGGIYNQSILTMNNTIVTGNTANTGGGIYSNGGQITLNNSTISGNTATHSNAATNGAGVYKNIGTFYLNNSIIANNTGSDCIGLTAAAYSLIEDGSCGISGSPTSPDANGNFTGDPNIDSTSFVPNAGSPVIDRGNPAAVSSGWATCLATDKNGTSRPIDGDGDTIARCDIGAFERSYTPPIVTLTLNQTAIDEGSTATFTLTRAFALASPLTVNLTLTAQNGLSAADYTLTDPFGNSITTSATIPANQTSIDLTFNAINDGSTAEDVQSLHIQITTGGDYTVGSPADHTVQINRNGLVVNSLNDSGEGSLRQAIHNANTFSSNDTITFTVSGTIPLASGLPAIANNSTLTINGGGTITLQGGSGSFSIISLGINPNVTLNGLTFTGGSTGLGGGVHMNTGTLTVNNSSFSGNTANGGGAIHNEAGTLYVNNSRFTNNSATNGGSILSRYGQSTIINSTFTGNVLNNLGGGVFNQASTVTIINSTFSGLRTFGGGSSIFTFGGTTSIYNSILANSEGGAECVNNGAMTIQYTLIEDGSCGVTGTPASPDANGNFTGAPNINLTTFMPNTGSPVIDRGNPATVGGGGSTCLATDKAGTVRPLDGDGDSVARCDIGAFEAPAAALPQVTVTVNNNYIAEGSTGTLTITRSFASPSALTVNLTVSEQNGLSAADYTLTDPFGNTITTSATIPANQTSINLTFTAIDDGDSAENIERLLVYLELGSGYTRGNPSGQFLQINFNGLVVTNGNNSGDGSLRQAISNAANDGIDSTITFSGVTTINLDTALSLNGAGTVTIDGGTGVTIQRVSGNITLFSIFSSTVTLNNLTLTGGNGFPGGAVYVHSDASLVMNNSTVSSSSSNTGYYAGGGIFNRGTITLNNSTISGNSLIGTGSGGGIYNSGTLTFNNSIVSGNSSDGYQSRGGGIYNEGGSVTLNNTTVTGNSVSGTVSQGGGIFSSGGSITLNNSTVSSNSASGGGTGGGISRSGGSITLNNSIIANSTGGDCTGSVTAHYSVIEDGSCGISGTPTSPDANGNFSGDPNIDPTTLMPNTGSPVIDRGNPAAVGGGGSTCLANDKAGTARPIDGDGDTVARCDIGAFEAPAPALPEVSIVLNNQYIDEGGTATFTLTHSFASPSALTVNLILTQNNDLSAGDYTLTDPFGNTITSSATIPANQTSIDLTFTAIDDGDSAELYENLFVEITAGSGYTRSFPYATSVFINPNGLVVTNGNDSGEGSLRFAVGNAVDNNINGTITFSSVTTVSLTGSNIVVSNNRIITIEGGSGVTIQRSSGNLQIFYIFSGTATLNSLTLTSTVTNSINPLLGVTSGAGAILNNTTITGNSVSGGVAGILNLGNLTLNNSTVSGNSAVNGPAGINNQGNLTLNNSIVSGNSMSGTFTGLGSGIHNSGTMTLNNSVVSGNSFSGSPTNRGGILNQGGGITLNNSIVANNTGGDCGGSVTAYYSVIEDGSCGISGTSTSPDANGNFAGDPNLNTTTLMPNAGSPVIDRGNPAAVGGGGSTCLANDKAGTARPLDGDGDTVARCDIGAFEAPASAVQTVTISGGGTVSEGASTTFTVERSVTSTNALTVNLTLTPGTDLNDGDYDLTDAFGNTITASMTIPANQPSISLTFAALNDGSSAETAETLGVSIATGDYVIGTSNSAFATINANGMTVTNTNDSGEGSLRVATTNANASGGTVDMTALNGTITLGSTIPVSNNITFDGNPAGTLFIRAEGFRAFSVTSGDVLLRAFTIVGGMEVSGGNVTIGNDPVIITGNNTNVCGGGLLVSGGSVTVQAGSEITGNTTTDNGGGICVTAGSLTVTGEATRINSNSATNGGGIYASGGSVTVEDGAAVSYNTASANGGAIYIGSGATLNVSSSFILGNAAANGDGVYSDNAGSVTNTCIVGNGDTAVVNTNGSLTATNNWWGTSWGPNIPAAPNTTGSYVSSGDSIDGIGEPFTSVDVGITLTPDNYGTYSTAPTGSWMTSDPGTCGTCSAVSGIGGSRTCVGSRP